MKITTEITINRKKQRSMKQCMYAFELCTYTRIYGLICINVRIINILNFGNIIIFLNSKANKFKLTVFEFNLNA